MLSNTVSDLGFVEMKNKHEVAYTQINKSLYTQADQMGLEPEDTPKVPTIDPSLRVSYAFLRYGSHALVVRAKNKKHWPERCSSLILVYIAKQHID